MSKVPGVLLEMGFISNKKDLELMKTSKFIDSYAQEVANGINNYFKKFYQVDPKQLPPDGTTATDSSGV